jgi:RNA polymerase sigma-70 factor (ECF subfamily)
MTKNGDVAEDLVQETLFEAWRNEHTLRDTERRGSWLFGIARNCCLRWLRTHKHDMAHLIQLQPDQELLLPDLADVSADDLDIEVALERKELIELLDRALMLLPPEMRTILIQRYIEESPLAEIADQLGTNSNAVAMRLHRGKLVLRRVLTQKMRQEMDLYIPNLPTNDWEETPLWCPSCGQQHLLGQRDPSVGKLLLRCPVCSSEVDEVFNRSDSLPALRGVKGYKPLYSRLAAWCDHYYRTGLREGSAACASCGAAIAASIMTPRDFPRWLRDKQEMQMWVRHSDERVVAILCGRCRSSCITSLEGLILESAEGQQFLKGHPRIRTLPRQRLEVDGRAAILTRFQSVTDTAKLDIISDEESYEVLHTYGDAL